MNDLVSGLQVEAILSERHRLTHIQCRSILSSGLVGEPVKLPAAHLYSATKARVLARRTTVDEELVEAGELAGERVVVLRLGGRRFLSAEEIKQEGTYPLTPERPPRRWVGWWEPEQFLQDQHDAVHRWWRLSHVNRESMGKTVLRRRSFLGESAGQPLIVTVGSVVVGGFEAALELDNSGDLAFLLTRPGTWFESYFKDRWLRTGPGRPLVWWSAK